MKPLRLLGAASAVALTAGAAQAQTPAAPAVAPAAAPLVARGDIVETLRAGGQFTILVKALETANMTGVLKTNRGLTIFAPTDAAFRALPPGELDRLLKDPAALQKLLTYHVVNATVDSSKIKGAKGGVKTVAGSDLQLDGSGDALRAAAATIVQTDVRATNGTVHVVDRVLAPSAAATTATAADASTTTGQTPPTPPPPSATPTAAEDEPPPAAPSTDEPSSPEPPIPPEKPKPFDGH